MAEMIPITIDGCEVEAEKGSLLIEVLRANGVDVPSLCHHPALSAYGSCRLCLVEVSTGRRSRLVASCTYPIMRPCSVRTNTEEVKRVRRFAAELLLGRAPESERVQQEAAKAGVTESRFLQPQADNCILCGLCVRVCEEIIGCTAISMAGRGAGTKVMSPFDKDSQACIACQACITVCPTDCIKFEDVGDRRRIDRWRVERQLVACEKCGRYFATSAVVELVEDKSGATWSLHVCPECRGEKLATEVASTRNPMQKTAI